jgi:hypothetical protein
MQSGTTVRVIRREGAFSDRARNREKSEKEKPPYGKTKLREAHMSTTMAAEFDEWYAAYPRKVGRLAAQKAYEKARKTGATAQELRAGIGRYIEHKPSYADFCHPQTWLSQGRWLDSYDKPEVVQKVAQRMEYIDYHAQREAARREREKAQTA